MAKKSSIKINYKITDIKQINAPGTLSAYLIGVELWDNTKKWRKAFKVDYGRPVSLEEFEKDMRKMDLKPEEKDSMAYLREEIGKEHIIEIENFVRME